MMSARTMNNPDAPRAVSPANALANGISATRRAFTLVGFLTVGVNALLLTVPLYLFQISDRVLTSQSMETLVMLTIIAMGALAVYALLDGLRRSVLTRAALGLETALGGPVFASSFDKPGAAQKDLQGLRDLSQLRNFLSGPVVPILFDVPLAPLFILVVYLIHPQLGVITLVGALLLFAIALVNRAATAKPLALVDGHAMRAHAQAEGQARNREVIRAMGMIGDCMALWGKENAQGLKAQALAGDRNATWSGLSKFLRLALQIAILGWGAFLALGGELTAGMIIAASIVAGRGLAPIVGSIEAWRSAVQANGAYRRVTHLLQMSSEDVARTELPVPKGKVKAERLLLVPAGQREPVLQDISFEIEPGESIAIIGPTGAGKSTLARMMVGALEPSSGCVRLDGVDVRHWDRTQFGRHVGYLPQDVELLPGTVASNIARMRGDASSAQIVEAAQLACVHELIAGLPQAYETDIRIIPLSGGQKQRVALARAFFGSPSFIVLDEPNANLDSEGEEALAEALRNAKEKGITVVTITQRPAVLRSADKVMVMKGGRIEAFVPRDEVLGRLMPVHKAPGNALQPIHQALQPNNGQIRRTS